MIPRPGRKSKVAHAARGAIAGPGRAGEETTSGFGVGGRCLTRQPAGCHLVCTAKGNRSVPVSPAVFEVHDSDVESLLRSLRDESQAINDGVVMLRGLPFSSTEDDIADFFSGNSAESVLSCHEVFTPPH